MKTEELLRLAEAVYPGQQVIGRDFGVVVRPKHGGGNLPDMFQFKPSLTGEDWQQAQALRVIVAADKIAGATDVWDSNLDDPKKSVYIRGIICGPDVVDGDILSASIASLLEGVE